MARGHGIGREFRCRLQEEAKRRNARITEDFIEDSSTLRGFRDSALALDDRNYRIPGKNPQVLLEECSLREFAAETIVDRNGHPVGQAYVEEYFRPTEESQSAFGRHTRRMREAGDISAVDWTMFPMLTGQLLINSTLQGWQHEEFKLSQAAGVYNTQFVAGEVVPGVSLPFTKDISEAGEDLLLVKPQQPFPYLTMGETYKILPPTEMRGGIMGVDRLAIYTDRTGLVAQNAAEGARLLGIRKEQRGLQLLVGADTVPYREKFLHDSKDVTVDPYQYEDGTGVQQFADGLNARKFPFFNDIADNELENWHAFEKADRYQSKLVDPNSGLPVTFRIPTVFACYTERFNIATVLNAFNLWRISQATEGITSGTVNTIGPNVVTEMLGKLDVQASRMLRQEMVKSGLYSEDGEGKPQADKVWFYGDLKEALKYITNWNIKVIMAPVNSEAEFTQDIVLRWRFDERGRWAWFEPRYIQRHNFQQTD